MTASEISSFIKVDEKRFMSAVYKSDINFKNRIFIKEYGKKLKDFSFVEVLPVLKKLGIHPIVIELLRESFITRSEPLFLEGMEQFLQETKRFCYRPCCETCVYLRGKVVWSNYRKIVPFCSFYEMDLLSKNTDIFHDYCKTYVYEKRKPYIWYNKSPDLDGSLVNGVDKSKAIHIDI